MATSDSIIWVVKEVQNAKNHTRNFLICIFCWKLNDMIDGELLKANGSIYEYLYRVSQGRLVHAKIYTHDLLGIAHIICISLSNGTFTAGAFVFDAKRDRFFVINCLLASCSHCGLLWASDGVEIREHQICSSGYLRDVRTDGTPRFLNGDHSNVPDFKSKCWRKMMHYWNGKLYRNNPFMWVTVHTWEVVEIITLCVCWNFFQRFFELTEIFSDSIWTSSTSMRWWRNECSGSAGNKTTVWTPHTATCIKKYLRNVIWVRFCKKHLATFEKPSLQRTYSDVVFWMKLSNPVRLVCWASRSPTATSPSAILGGQTSTP